MRTWPLALAVILGVALLAACGGGEEEEEGDAARATTEAPAAAATVGATGTPQLGATGTPRQGSPSATTTGSGAQTVGCEFPPDIESYRFEMTMEANLPTTPEADTGEEDLGGFLGALSGLMGDMKIEGAFIKPDRSSMVMTVGGHEFGSFIQIGSQSWMKVAGLTDWTEQPSEESEFIFSPLDLCESTEESLSTALSEFEGKKETVNGIKAIHYHIDKANRTFLQELLGGTEDLGELPDEFNMDVWLAEDGDWPVRMNLEASGEDEEGEPLSFDISIEFKDFNDSGIKIEPPT